MSVAPIPRYVQAIHTKLQETIQKYQAQPVKGDSQEHLKSLFNIVVRGMDAYTIAVSSSSLRSSRQVSLAPIEESAETVPDARDEMLALSLCILKFKTFYDCSSSGGKVPQKLLENIQDSLKKLFPWVNIILEIPSQSTSGDRERKSSLDLSDKQTDALSFVKTIPENVKSMLRQMKVDISVELNAGVVVQTDLPNFDFSLYETRKYVQDLVPKTPQNIFCELGIQPIQLTNATSAEERMESFVKDGLGATDDELRNLFHYFENTDTNLWECSFKFRDNNVKTTKQNKETPKKDFSKEVLSKFAKTEQYHHFFLAKIEEDDASNPREKLATLIKKCSYYANGVQYKYVDLGFSRKEGQLLHMGFSCQAFFETFELSTGLGITKDSAQNDAALNALYKFDMALALMPFKEKLALSERIQGSILAEKAKTDRDLAQNIAQLSLYGRARTSSKS